MPGGWCAALLLCCAVLCCGSFAPAAAYRAQPWPPTTCTPRLRQLAPWRPSPAPCKVQGQLAQCNAVNPQPWLHVPASSPAMQAPEVMSGDAPGPAADVYSFALVLWSLLALEEPWAGTQTWQVG